LRILCARGMLRRVLLIEEEEPPDPSVVWPLFF
jgi:hypothetical protein